MSKTLDTKSNHGKEITVLGFIEYIKSKLASIRLKIENQVKSHDPYGPLPKSWEERRDRKGRKYFANLKSRTTQWEDPRIHGFEDPLPPGWNIKYNFPIRVYFDQNTNTTTLIDPRRYSKAGSKGQFKPVPYYLKLRWKLADFHSLCECNQGPNTIKITFTRENIFKDSFSQIMKIPPHQLRGKLLVTCKEERWLDNEDVASKWIYLLSSEVLNPKFGLFEYADKYERSVEFNPASDRKSLLYCRFLGRIIAMAIFHRKFIPKHFTKPFYKRILGKELIMKDIEPIDSEFYNSLLWIKENNIEECGLELYFSVDLKIHGRIRSHNLKPGGSKIKVIEENKEEFLRLMTSWRLSRGQKQQIKSFLSGFNEVFPSGWLHYFHEIELEHMLCGMQEVIIDMKDWKEHTIYRNCSEKYIRWFWKYVYQLDYYMQARLLQFVTGNSRVPVGGFAYLMGSYGPQRFCIQIVGDETELPKSHTCFNRLDLPPYTYYQQFKRNMNHALELTSLSSYFATQSRVGQWVPDCPHPSCSSDFPVFNLTVVFNEEIF